MAYIILLDGSKGAGKTTVGKMLAQRLENAAFLSLDDERRLLPNPARTRTGLNREAFEHVVEKADTYLDNGMNLIIDCGLTDERVSTIEALAKKKAAEIHRFLLKGSYETELNRVRSRDSEKGKETDEPRFAEVHKIVHSKDFRGFTTIDTDQLDSSDVADTILKSLEQ